MAKIKIVYWHDIPGQVVVREGRGSTRLRLSPRFMGAIQRAGYRLKKVQKNAQFDLWHDVDQPFNGNALEQAKLLVAQLEEQYSDADLEQLIRTSGKAASRNLDS